jgi:chromosome segregation ATPase
LKDIKNTIDKINAIGKVTLDSEKTIDAAQDAYDALDDEQKAQVTNYNALLEAKLALAQLKLDAANSTISELTTERDNALTDKSVLEGQLKQAEEDKKAAQDELQAIKDEIAASKLTVSRLKVTSKARKFTVTWKKNAKANGYQIQYKLKSAKKFSTLKTLAKTKFVSKKLKKGKKYQFRVRTYTIVDGSKVYGKWTKVKTVKCK